DQICCGPVECGHCISKLSGQACIASCPGGGGTGGTTGGAGAGGSSGADCSSLLADVNAKLALAQACNTASAKPTMECAGTLEGVCCPVLVEAPATANSDLNTAYLNALHTYNQKCPHACPAIACFDPQPGNCVATQGSAQGTCGGGTGI